MSKSSDFAAANNPCEHSCFFSVRSLYEHVRRAHLFPFTRASFPSSFTHPPYVDFVMVSGHQSASSILDVDAGSAASRDKVTPSEIDDIVVPRKAWACSAM